MIKKRGKVARGLIILGSAGESVRDLASGMWRSDSSRRWMIPLAVFLCLTGLLLTLAVGGRAGLLKLLAATVLSGLGTWLARTARCLTGLPPRCVRIDAARIGAAEVALLAHDPLSGRLRRVDLADKALIALLLLR